MTFGRLALVDSDGVDEPSLSTRRRKLALLAYLAFQRRPIPREIVLEMFWGRSDETRARRSLSDALSHLRRVLGRGLVVPYSSDLAVATDALPSVDALELEEAARQGDHERVIHLYAGPFLSGVHVEGSSSFEDWSTERRRHFAELFVTSCSASCLGYARSRRWNECAMVARLWLEQRPDSENAALYYLNALKAPGTQDALRQALAGYEWLRARIARDFDEKPGRAVEELIAEVERLLDSGSSAATVPGASSSRQPHPFLPMRDDGSGRYVGSIGGPGDDAPSMTRPSSPLASRRAGWSVKRLALAVAGTAVALSALAALAGAFGRDRNTLANAHSASVGQRPVVAVLPMTVAADSTLRWLGSGLQAMIAAKLSHVEGVEAIATEASSTADSVPPRVVPPGATIAATGVVTRRAGQLRLELVVRGRDGDVVAHRSLSAADAVHLADAAAVQLLLAASVQSRSPSLGEMETSSVDAYQRYIEARRAYEANDDAAAVKAVDEAIRLDSGFVSALFLRYRLSAYDEKAATRIARLIAKHRERASEFDRMQLDAFDAYYAGDHSRAELLAAAFYDRFPHSVEAYETFLGVLSSHGRSAEAEALITRRIERFQAEGADEREICALHVSRANLRKNFGDLGAAVADARRALTLCPYRPEIADYGAWVLMAAGQLHEARVAAQRYRAITGQTHRLITSRLLLRARRYDEAESLAVSWQRIPSGEALDDGFDLEVLVARERGQFERAERILQRWRERGDWLALMDIDQLARLGRRADLRRTIGPLLTDRSTYVTLAGDTVPFTGEPVRGWTWHRALYADALARLGDSATARAYADSLRAIGDRSYFGRDWRVHHHVAGVLAARAGEWKTAVRELAASLWGRTAWTRTRVELANAYLALGRPIDAVATLRDAYVANLDAMGRYVPQSELDFHLARAYAAAGQADSAAVYSGYVRRAWVSADPAVHGRLRELPER